LPRSSATSEPPKKPITSFSVVKVPKGTLPPEKKSSESFLDDSGIDGALSKTRREFFAKLVLGLILLLVGGFLLLLSGGPQDNSRVLSTANGNKLNLEVVDAETTRQQGLSGRGLLDGGMLFVFDESGRDHCMWMRDMNFAIDIIWLDESKTVIDLKQSVVPATYPENFCPTGEAKYVIELNSGDANKLELKPGQKIKF